MLYGLNGLDRTVATTKGRIVMAVQKTEVTRAQSDELRAMAIAKGITKRQWQLGMDHKDKFPLFLHALRHGFKMDLVFEPPVGGRIHIVRGVPATLDLDFNEAINSGAPQTPSDFVVRKVGHLYLPTGKGIVERDQQNPLNL